AEPGRAGADPMGRAPGRPHLSPGEARKIQCPRVLGRVRDRVELAVDGEALERRGLDLAHALARDSQLPADRVERLRVAVAVEAVAELDDLALALRQLVDGATQGLLLEAVGDLVLRRLLIGRDELAERALVLGPDRPVEARHRPGHLPHLTDLLQRQLRPLRDLLLSRHSPELRRQLAFRPRHLLLALDDVDGDPDRPRLVRDAALDRLADPPGPLGREIEAAAPVELLDRPDQADDSLLDQIEQVQLV